MPFVLRALVCAAIAVPVLAARAQAQSVAPPSGTPITLAVDATQAAQQFYRVNETLPAAPGPFTFVYPKWIPGYHGPVGPIENVVNLHVSAGGEPVAWRRDLVDLYAVHVDVPAGARAVQLEYAVVGADSKNGQISPVSTSKLALVEFSNFTSYALGTSAVATPVDATLTLPHGWTYGTALPVRGRDGDTIAFAPASLYTLVDSPVIAGAHEREFTLGGNAYLDAASDSAEGIAIAPEFLTGLKHLVAEAPALYGGEHYRDYHFLLTLSDEVAPEGIEHHESSDDRNSELYATDAKIYSADADLLPHEYSHSWNGKYRRPADLAVDNYQDPEKTDLLWVYEGLNQYNGEKLSTRAGLNDFQVQLDELAEAAAAMDVENGRDWRPIRDTADAAPFLYVAPSQYHETRRSAGDFYTEGNLIWLDADVRIRELTGGKRSLDDVMKLWGNGTDTKDAPHYLGYDEAQVVALMNRVAPYEWRGFFGARVADIAPRAPLHGITAGGYELVYTAEPSALETARAARSKKGAGVDARYSVGLALASDGTVETIIGTSQAFRVGLAPGQKIVAVDGRRFSPEIFEAALKAHAGRATPMALIVENGDAITSVAIDASMGPRFPHLVRVPGTPDRLAEIYRPSTFAPPVRKHRSASQRVRS